MAALLLDRGADMNARDDAGATALYNAASWGRRDVVELLVARGADAGLRTKAGATPLDGAVANGFEDIAGLLRTHAPR
jgi:ankyrin repeat protein